MLYMHDRRRVPIGKWEDIRKEADGTLTAEAVFDKEDEFAQSIESKVDQGILSATSIGFDVTELSEDTKYLLPGQSRATVTKSELLEASIVDIPGNKNAIKLNFPSKGLSLSGDVDTQFLNSVLPQLNPSFDMKKIISALALLGASLDPALTLAEDANEDQVAEHIGKLAAKFKTSQAELLVKVGEATGLVTDKNKARIEKLAQADASLALEFLSEEKPLAADTSKPEPRLADALKEIARLNAGGSNSQNTPNDPRAAWTMRDWEKKDSNGLLAMKQNDRERYNQLFKAEYGTTPK